MFETNEFSIEGEQDLDGSFEEAFNTPQGAPSQQILRRNSGFEEYFENRSTADGYDEGSPCRQIRRKNSGFQEYLENRSTASGYDEGEASEVEISSEEWMSEGEVSIEESSQKVCSRSLIIFIVLFALSLVATTCLIYKVFQVNGERDSLQNDLRSLKELVQKQQKEIVNLKASLKEQNESFLEQLKNEKAELATDLEKKQKQKLEDELKRRAEVADGTTEEAQIILKDFIDTDVDHGDLLKAVKKGYQLFLECYKKQLEETEWEKRLMLIDEAVCKNKVDVDIVQYLLEVPMKEIEDIESSVKKDFEVIQRIVKFSLKHGLGKLALNGYGMIMWKAEYRGHSTWWLKYLGILDLEKIKLLKQSERDCMGRVHQNNFKQRSQGEFEKIQKHFGNSHEIVDFYKADILS